MPISCKTILFRAILRNGWFDPDNLTAVNADAFFRRPPIETEGVRNPRDEDGLSLFRADRIDPDGCIDEFSRCFGIVSLHAGTLMDFGLRIVEDNEDSRKVLITNLPYENPGTPEAEKLAGDVAKSARIVRRNPKGKTVS